MSDDDGAEGKGKAKAHLPDEGRVVGESVGHYQWRCAKRKAEGVILPPHVPQRRVRWASVEARNAAARADMRARRDASRVASCTLADLAVKIAAPCCQLACGTMFADPDAQEVILAVRKKLQSPVTRADRRAELWSYLQQHQISILKVTVCRQFFKRVLGIGSNNVDRMLKRQREGELHPVVLSMHVPVAHKAEQVVAWLQKLAQAHEFQPDRRHIHLSHGHRSLVYDEFLREVEKNNGLRFITRQYFYKIWRRDCNHIKVRKACRFSICTTCDQFRHEYSNTVDPKERERIKKEIIEHLKFIRRERVHYKSKCQDARDAPDKYASIIIDGADQVNYLCPGLCTKPKKLDKEERMQVHLVGAIEHSRRRSYAFLTGPEVPNDSNLTITALYMILSDLHRVGGGRLPPHLFLQMDNCGRDNKNKYVFSFLAWLIERGVFDSIEAAFLPVGHTHEDIDQMFSCFCHDMSWKEFGCRTQLAAMLAANYTPTPTIVQLGGSAGVANWSTFMKDGKFIPSGFSGVTRSRAFVFTRDDEDRCRIRTKENSSDSVWLGEHGADTPGVRIFARPSPSFDDILHKLPSSLRNKLDADYIKRVRRCLHLVHSMGRKTMTDASLAECLENVRWMDESLWASEWPQHFDWPDGGANLLSIDPDSEEEKEGKGERKRGDVEAGDAVERSSLSTTRSVKYTIFKTNIQINVKDMCICIPERHRLLNDEGKLIRFWVAQIKKIHRSHITVHWWNASHEFGHYEKLYKVDGEPHTDKIFLASCRLFFQWASSDKISAASTQFPKGVKQQLLQWYPPLHGVALVDAVEQARDIAREYRRTSRALEQEFEADLVD